MTAYLSIIGVGFKKIVYKVFTNKSAAVEHNAPYYNKSYYTIEILEIELITDEFMQQILQPKEQHEINTNSSVQ